MKLIVIGGSGLIGSHLLKAGTAAGHATVGTYRRLGLPDLLPLDCADTAAMENLIDQQKPDAVIHSAGWTWVDGCEDDPARAFAENADQPAQLARLCHARGTQFAYISTSYVFDGTQGPYAEDAIANPINVYAQSKWQGEQRIQAACAGEALIARVICVYGAETQKKNFAYQVWNALRDGKTLTLPSDQCGNPTCAADIARWLVKLLERRERGVWHLAGPWPNCTRPEWADKLVTALTAAGVPHHPNFTIKTLPTAELKQKALRPLKAGMVSTRTGGLGFVPSEFDHPIREMLRDL